MRPARFVTTTQAREKHESEPGSRCNLHGPSPSRPLYNLTGAPYHNLSVACFGFWSLPSLYHSLVRVKSAMRESWARHERPLHLRAGRMLRHYLSLFLSSGRVSYRRSTSGGVTCGAATRNAEGISQSAGTPTARAAGGGDGRCCCLLRDRKWGRVCWGGQPSTLVGRNGLECRWLSTCKSSKQGQLWHGRV